MSVCKKVCSVTAVILVFSLLSSLFFHINASQISAKSAILIDAQSGSVLFSKNADLVLPMASTTKIMTAVVVIEHCDPNAKVRIPADAVGIEGSSIYLCKDEVLTVKQLLYALLLSSANDAAVALAIFTAGSIDRFSEMMNDTAARLGLASTHFDNPHGLDSKAHYTTAADLARLTAYALKLNDFKEIVSKRKERVPFDTSEGARLLVNHNKLLSLYDGTIGVKTGYTKKSGRCLVSAAERNGVILIAVTLNAPDDWNDHIKMLDYGFDNYSLERLTDQNQGIVIPVVSGNAQSVFCVPQHALDILLPHDNGSITCIIEAYPFAYAPVKSGEKMGEIVYYHNEKEIGRVSLIALNDVYLKKQKYTLLDKLADIFLK